jgi:hypothetical protein
MKSRWSDFTSERVEESVVCWKGPLRGFQKWYQIAVLWNFDSLGRPYVCMLKPQLRPRQGQTFEQIPHLIFNEEKPPLSGFCLFDPHGKEWSDRLLIADTTLPWAAEWLLYYELWHLDGVWRGGGVGFESIAAARAAPLH